IITYKTYRMIHIPVLLNEVIEYLSPQPGQKFIDATIGGGGHALAILERIMPGGKLLGIEWDGELAKRLEAQIRHSQFKDGVILINDSYANLERIAEDNDFKNAQGVIFDLGMSSWHLEESGGGFSFAKDEPLDMRYRDANLRMYANAANEENQLTAREIINRYSYDELVKILKENGEEKFAKRIAEAIVRARKEKPITTTFQLVEIIKNSIPFRYRRGRIPRRSASGTLRGRHFATKTFQALRIAVNDELENIKSGIGHAKNILAAGGRLAVISFHSLEDRIVKNFFREESKKENLKILTKKPVRAGLAEITANPRARSAKLRVAEKL
ncbi:MAG: 16S rRNA (cytosine(1402)-N(4))-methyltransferase RsmH, partial [Patescibacteria group bacterium]